MARSKKAKKAFPVRLYPIDQKVLIKDFGSPQEAIDALVKEYLLQRAVAKGSSHAIK